MILHVPESTPYFFNTSSPETFSRFAMECKIYNMEYFCQMRMQGGRKKQTRTAFNI
jgi:hypothetical protein